MMKQAEILKEWSEHKLTGVDYYRLAGACSIEYEFRGPQMGHPSNYARVNFKCEPADALEFHSLATWPGHFDQEERDRHEQAIRIAIVDELFCRSPTPRSGCSLSLIEVAYDNVSSSPAAFYQATVGAVAVLIKTKEWRF